MNVEDGFVMFSNTNIIKLILKRSIIFKIEFYYNFHFEGWNVIRFWVDILKEANNSLNEDCNEAYNNIDIDVDDIVMEDDIVD